MTEPEPDRTVNTLRVIALADSLALPRDEGVDVVRWEETWPYVLARELARRGVDNEVINCGSRTRTVETLAADFDEHVVFKRPDLLVMHVGIVDCAPRVLSRFENRILRRAPRWIRSRVLRNLSEHRVTRIGRDPLARVYVPPRRFEERLTAFFERVRRQPRPIGLLVAPILGDRQFMERKSPGFGANMELYNDILETTCRRAQGTWLPERANLRELLAPDNYSSDGYHLSPAGNLRLATSIAETLCSMYRGPCRHTRSSRQSG